MISRTAFNAHTRLKTPGQKIAVSARCDDGDEITLGTRRRLDTPVEVEYFRNGGILHTVLRKLCVE